jgi:hypothetical protein
MRANGKLSNTKLISHRLHTSFAIACTVAINAIPDIMQTMIIKAMKINEQAEGGGMIIPI